MLVNHIDERGAAGCRLALSGLHRLGPLVRLGCGRQIAAQSYLEQIGKACLFERSSPGIHRDVLAILSLDGRCDHGVDLLSCADHIDDIDDKSLRSDRAERARMNAVAALNALALINLAESGFRIHRNSADRAGLLAGTDQIHNGPVRAGAGAHTALLALRRINMRPVLVSVV